MSLWRAVLLIGLLAGSGAQAACSDDTVELRGPFGQARFTVEIADTAAERSRGLMFREKMARSAGMLFLYDRPQAVGFWMKNTLIPLDMLFIDEAGRVVRVHSGAVPGDLTPIESGAEVVAVLEINGGLAGQLGIEAGAEVRHPGFDQAAAVWTCAE